MANNSNVRSSYWLSTENTPKSSFIGSINLFIVYHLLSFIISIADSGFYSLYGFIYYKTHVHSIDPPTHLSSSSPSFFQFAFSRRRVPSSPPVVASPVQSRHAQLMRSSVHTHEKCSSLRPAHESNPNSRSVRKAIFTTHTILHRSQISFRPISDPR